MPMDVSIAEDRLNEVIETYKCLIVACEKMPGMSIETAFNSSALASLKSEQAWLRSIQQEIIHKKEVGNE